MQRLFYKLLLLLFQLPCCVLNRNFSKWRPLPPSPKEFEQYGSCQGELQRRVHDQGLPEGDQDQEKERDQRKPPPYQSKQSPPRSCCSSSTSSGVAVLLLTSLGSPANADVFACPVSCQFPLCFWSLTQSQRISDCFLLAPATYNPPQRSPAAAHPDPPPPPWTISHWQCLGCTSAAELAFSPFQLGLQSIIERQMIRSCNITVQENSLCSSTWGKMSRMEVSKLGCR